MQRKKTPKGIEVWLYYGKFVWFPDLGRGTYLEGKFSLANIDAIGERLAAGPKLGQNQFCLVIPITLDKSVLTD